MEVTELPGTERVVRVRFRGIVYRRYPAAKQSSDRNYFRAGRSDVYKGRSYLHRDLWVAAHGPIADGYEVDHVDGNPLNNALDNLQLLPAAVHRAKHAGALGDRSRARWLAMSDEQRAAMRAAAAEWHRSDAGRAWHSGHAKRIAAAVPSVPAVCEQCGAGYTVKRNAKRRSRFCSNNCKSAARRRSGVDDVVRACRCGVVFTANRYSPARNCSAKCARGPGATRPCERCAEPFRCPPCKSNRYCGRACAYAARREAHARGVQPERRGAA